MKVLVIDGNQKIAEVLSSYMELLGYEADEAIDGREAIRQLQNTHYDIVITDSEITSIDGAELCKFIKSYFHDIYIIGKPIEALSPSSQCPGKVPSLSVPD